MKRTKWGYLRHLAYKTLPLNLYLRLWYKASLGEFPNLKNPKTFNEKMCWLKIYYRQTCPELLRTCFDKYLVRQYVEEKIGDKYLVPLIGVYKETDDIPFEELPNEYIIKLSQSCGMNYIVFNNATEDYDAIRKQLKSWLKEARNYHKYIEEEDFEYDGNPYIIIEELLKNPDGTVVDDYKIYCLNGRVEFIRVADNPVDENGERKKRFVYNTYDREWSFLELSTSKNHYSDSSIEISKPINLEEMITVAETLSKDFPFARIDLYNVAGNIYFGEITWFPGGGLDTFDPQCWDEYLGNRLLLPQ